MEHEAVLTSSLNSAKTKRDKIIKKANHYKTVLKTWENAVTKAEGRQPGKVNCYILIIMLTILLILLFFDSC